MKKGDIVVCTYKHNTTISYGKQYEILDIFMGQTGSIVVGCKFITIANNYGIINDYRVEKFKLLSEWREERLKGIGI
jgi:hypothetical protein